MDGGGGRLGAGQVETVAAAASTGAAWAFEALYRHFAPSVVGYGRAQGVDDPEDLCSEVFLAVFRGIGAFRGGDAELRTWLFAIAHRKVIDERRRRARRRVAPRHAVPVASAAARGGDTEAEALAGLDAERTARLCGRLTGEQRDVIVMRLVADLSLDETARALGKTVGAVKALQHRGLRALKNELIEEISRQGVSR